MGATDLTSISQEMMLTTSGVTAELQGAVRKWQRTKDAVSELAIDVSGLRT